MQQQDARTQRVCLYYDDLGRVTGKYYTMSDCPTTPPPAQDMNVRYWYDDYSDSAIFYDYSGPTTYAIGQRTGMLDASGHSMWAMMRAGG